MWTSGCEQKPLCSGFGTAGEYPHIVCTLLRHTQSCEEGGSLMCGDCLDTTRRGRTASRPPPILTNTTTRPLPPPLWRTSRRTPPPPPLHDMIPTPQLDGQLLSLPLLSLPSPLPRLNRASNSGTPPSSRLNALSRRLLNVPVCSLLSCADCYLR